MSIYDLIYLARVEEASGCLVRVRFRVKVRGSVRVYCIECPTLSQELVPHDVMHLALDPKPNPNPNPNPYFVIGSRYRVSTCH